MEHTTKQKNMYAHAPLLVRGSATVVVELGLGEGYCKWRAGVSCSTLPQMLSS